MKLTKLADTYRLELRAYPTTMFGQNDDEGIILVPYFKIANSFDKAISPQLRDNIKVSQIDCISSTKHFRHLGQVSDE